MRRLRQIRPVVIIAFALAVVAQPLAASLCHCNSHGDAGSMAGAHSDAHGHGERHAGAMTDHAGMVADHAATMADHAATMAGHASTAVSHSDAAADSASHDECESSVSACQCDACGQSFGLIVQTAETITRFPVTGAIAPPHYLEPPQRRALRPPINV